MNGKEMLKIVTSLDYSKYLKTKIFTTADNEAEAEMVMQLINKKLPEEKMNTEIDRLREKLGRPKR